jgi:hypothetical protein
MEQSRPAAERVRPVLLAMERSINAARQRRLHENEPESVETDTPAPLKHTAPIGESDTPARLRAKPKRPSAFPAFGDGSTIRSQAG